MKKIKLFSVLAAFVSALSFTSCNTGGDSYTELTKEQQDNYQTSMSLGTYNNMKLYYSHKNLDNVNNMTDSVDISVDVSFYKDSTMTINNFPIAAIAEHVKNNDALAAAIAKEAPRSIKCKYVVLSASNANAAYFYMMPNPITLNLTYGEPAKAHEVTFYFTYDATRYNICTLSPKKQMGFQFYLAAIYIDKSQSGYLQNSTTTSTAYVPFWGQPAWEKK